MNSKQLRFHGAHPNVNGQTFRCDVVHWNAERKANGLAFRQRLKTMKEIFGDEIDATETAKRKRAVKKRNGNCIDNLIDGSFMGKFYLKKHTFKDLKVT